MAPRISKTINGISFTDYHANAYFDRQTPASIAAEPKFESVEQFRPLASQFVSLSSAETMAKQSGKLRGNGTILDVGCGGGQMGLIAARQAQECEYPDFSEVYFIDIMDQQAEIQNLFDFDHGGLESVHAVDNFLQTDFRQDDILRQLGDAFGLKQFDHVFCKMLLHFVEPASQLKAVRQLLTMVAEGGQLHINFEPRLPPGLEEACAQRPSLEVPGWTSRPAPPGHVDDGFYSIFDYVNLSPNLEHGQIHAFGAIDERYCARQLEQFLQPLLADGHSAVWEKLWALPDDDNHTNATGVWEVLLDQELSSQPHLINDMATREASRRCFLSALSEIEIQCRFAGRQGIQQVYTLQQVFAYAVIVNKHDHADST